MVKVGAPAGFIDFDIVGNERGVEEMLEAIDTALSPVGLAAFFGMQVGPFIKERAQDRFAAEGDDASGAWAPLSPATVEIRESLGFEGAHPINQRTGELEQYITQSQVGIFATPLGSSMKYPKDPPATKGLKEKLSTAQKGRNYPKTKPRPVLAMNETDLAAIMTMLAFHVQAVGVTRNAGS